jgi:hypothetical protein
MSARERPRVSARRFAQAIRVGERNAFVAGQAARRASALRAANQDEEKTALTGVLMFLWEAVAEGFPPPLVSLLRWLFVGIVPMTGSFAAVFLSSLSWDRGLMWGDAAAVAAPWAVFLLALVMTTWLALARLGRASLRATRIVIAIGTVFYVILGAGSLLLVALFFATEGNHLGDTPFMFAVFAIGPVPLFGVGLLIYHIDARSAAAVERLATRCAGRVEIGASVLRRWLDRYWEGEVSHDQLEPRSSSAYLVTSRIGEFEVAIEIRPDSGNHPPMQVLVAVALDEAALPALAELDALLRSSGFVAQASTGGIVARPCRGERGVSTERRGEAMDGLHDCARGIVAFLQRAGVAPLEPLRD